MKVTVKQLIDSLAQFPMDATVEIAVNQYNSHYPVAYCSPDQSAHVEGLYATCENGKSVRVHISLPHDEEKMMITQTRKIK